MNTEIKFSNLSSVNGGSEKAILAAKDLRYEWENGKRISGDPIGTRFTVVLQGSGLRTITIDVDGNDTLPEITTETINATNLEGKFTYVRFDGIIVEVRPDYNDKGKLIIKGAAKSIKLT